MSTFMGAVHGFKKSVLSLKQAVRLHYLAGGLSPLKYSNNTDLINDLFKTRMNVLEVKNNPFKSGYRMTDCDFTNKGNPVCTEYTPDISNTIITQDGYIYYFVENKRGDGAIPIVVDVNGQRRPNKPTINKNEPQDQYTLLLYDDIYITQKTIRDPDPGCTEPSCYACNDPSCFCTDPSCYECTDDTCPCTDPSCEPTYCTDASCCTAPSCTECIGDSCDPDPGCTDPSCTQTPDPGCTEPSCGSQPTEPTYEPTEPTEDTTPTEPTCPDGQVYKIYLGTTTGYCDYVNGFVGVAEPEEEEEEEEEKNDGGVYGSCEAYDADSVWNSHTGLNDVTNYIKCTGSTGTTCYYTTFNGKEVDGSYYCVQD